VNAGNVNQQNPTVSYTTMPPLDPREEEIVVACIRHGGNQTAAWRETHPKSKAKPNVMAVEASKFFARPNVRLRLAELHLEVASKLSDDAALTIGQHMQQLRELRDTAKERGQLSAAIQAEVKRGELRRFYVKQVETGDAGEFARMSDEELRAFVYGEEMPAKGSKGPVKH
jgi:hypothetical protein